MKRALVVAVAILSGCATAAHAPMREQTLQSLLTPVNHNDVKPEELAGKVVLLNVWASWCNPCAEALTYDAQLQEQLKDQGFVLLTLNVDADRRVANAFLHDIKLDDKLRVLHDPEAKQVEKHYDIVRLPTAYLIDRQGVVRHVESGFFNNTRQKTREVLDSLLREPVPTASRL